MNWFRSHLVEVSVVGMLAMIVIACIFMMREWWQLVFLLVSGYIILFSWLILKTVHRTRIEPERIEMFHDDAGKLHRDMRRQRWQQEEEAFR